MTPLPEFRGTNEALQQNLLPTGLFPNWRVAKAGDWARAMPGVKRGGQAHPPCWRSRGGWASALWYG